MACAKVYPCGSELSATAARGFQEATDAWATSTFDDKNSSWEHTSVEKGGGQRILLTLLSPGAISLWLGFGTPCRPRQGEWAR